MIIYEYNSSVTHNYQSGTRHRPAGQCMVSVKGDDVMIGAAGQRWSIYNNGLWQAIMIEMASLKRWHYLQPISFSLSLALSISVFSIHVYWFLLFHSHFLIRNTSRFSFSLFGTLYPPPPSFISTMYKCVALFEWPISDQLNRKWNSI